MSPGSGGRSPAAPCEITSGFPRPSPGLSPYPDHPGPHGGVGDVHPDEAVVRRLAGLPPPVSPCPLRSPGSTPEGRVRLWDLTAAPPKELPPLRGPGGVNCGVTFSPDGKRLACAGTDGKARLWDWDRADNAFRPRGHIEHPTPLEAVAFSPDGRTLATAGHATIIRLWDVAGGKFTPSAMLEGHREHVTHVEYARDGRWLLSSGHDHYVFLWDVGAARPAQTWKFPDLGTWAALAPDGRHLAVRHAGSVYLRRRRPNPTSSGRNATPAASRPPPAGLRTTSPRLRPAQPA